LLPVVAVFLLLVMNSRSLLGAQANGWLANLLGSLVVAVAVGLGGLKILDVFGWL
jgi:manganese transport protein